MTFEDFSAKKEKFKLNSLKYLNTIILISEIIWDDKIIFYCAVIHMTPYMYYRVVLNMANKLSLFLNIYLIDSQARATIFYVFIQFFPRDILI